MTAYSLEGKRAWVAGHRGMVGSAIVRRLQDEQCEILTVDRRDVDLTNQLYVKNWISNNKPDIIFLAAAKVGGIHANDTFPVDFLYNNLMIEANVIQAAFENGVQKMLFLGSSCIYPKFADQPIVEEALLTGPLEPSNEWYAVAKITGIKLCQAYRKQHGADFISAMPTNLYGPGDNFDLKSSHVMPAIIRKAYEAAHSNSSEIVVWGTGTPRREFLHVDDCADACVHLMKVYSDYNHVNVGSSEDISILALTELVCELVGFTGTIVHDYSKLDGTPRKLMSSAKLQDLGWKPSISLRDGVKSTIDWYLENIETVKDGKKWPRS